MVHIAAAAAEKRKASGKRIEAEKLTMLTWSWRMQLKNKTVLIGCKYDCD